jgi:hypothetical protein
MMRILILKNWDVTHSQETPPDAAWTEPPRGKPKNFISPKTLLKGVEKQNAIPMNKKERKK